MRGYSFPTLLGRALRGHRGWPPAWRSSEPGKVYDVVVVGAGGHGLATAYYLAKNHGITNVAVLEKGWLGGCRPTRFAQVAAVIVATGLAEFELYVDRGYDRYLRDWLEDAALIAAR